MSLREIEPERFIWSCDTCGASIEAMGEFHMAWSVVKSRGFVAFKESGSWWHRCAKCCRPSKATVNAIMDRVSRKADAVPPPSIFDGPVVAAEHVDLARYVPVFTGKIRSKQT